MKQITCLAAALAGILVLLTGSGCAARNNYRECKEFFDFLVRNDVKVYKSQALRPDPFRADSGMAFTVDGDDLGKPAQVDVAVYKFNADIELSRNRLAEIKKSNCVYLLGVKLPTKINGSFILLGYERTIQKKKILKAFEEFK